MIVTHYLGAANDWVTNWFWWALWKSYPKIHGARQRVLFLGDSHVRPLALNRGHLWKAGFMPAVISVSGATASGIQNPHSTTGARERFSQALKSLNAESVAVVGLGEVDVGFLVYEKAARSGQSVRACTDEALARYIDYITEIEVRIGCRIVVLGIIPPTVDDYARWPGLDGARKSLRASIFDRRIETIYWNQTCRFEAQSRGWAWIEVLDNTTASNGSVLKQYQNDDPKDHHLEPRAYANLVTKKFLESPDR